MPPALTQFRTHAWRSASGGVSRPMHSQARPVALWLFVICAMLWVMIVLGGTTRLTGSGLSIMEWAPLDGALPPMSHAEWERLFALYQKIPQYSLLHEGFGLAGFKQIFWLEWLHRLWGRLIGLVFFVPFCWFLLTGRLSRKMLRRLAGLFVLGALQGAVGWFMVASGFEPDRISVSPYRLVAHLSLALILYSCLFWLALSTFRPTRAPSRRLRGLSIATVGLICCVGLTILAGGFVSGLHAGLIYNTFPLMDGRLFPSGYFALTPWMANLTANITAVQFDHRALASVTAVFSMLVVFLGFAAHPPMLVRRALTCVATAIVLQYALGVATLVYVVPITLAACHQASAVLLLSSTLFLLHTTRVSDCS